MLALSFFAIELFMNQNITSNIIHENIQKTGNGSSVQSIFYNPKNLLYLFVVVDGLLLPTGIIGFVKLKNSILLKIPLLKTAAASFSWIVFPFHDSLVADRWIILLGTTTHPNFDYDSRKEFLVSGGICPPKASAHNPGSADVN